MADNRPIVYYESGKGWIYRASAIGGCIKALVAARLGIGANPDDVRSSVREAAAAGTALEDDIVAEMESIGWVFHSRQELVEIEVMPEVWVRGHTDGHASWRPPKLEYCAHPLGAPATHVGLDFIAEFKSKSPNYFAKWKREGFSGNQSHRFQITTYHHGEMARLGKDRLPIIYVAGQRADDDGPRRIVDWDVRVLDEPPGLWGEVTSRIAQVQMIAQSRQLPACDQNDYIICEYKRLNCGGPAPGDPDEGPFGQEELLPGDAFNERFTVEEMEELEALARKHRVLSDAVKRGKDAENERKALNKRALELIGTKKGEKVEAGGIQIAVRGRGRKVTDTDRMHADMRKAGLDPDSYVRDATEEEESRWIETKEIK